MKIEQSLPTVLSPEEKKYLRSYTRYLKASGMSEGLLEIEFDDYVIDDIHWEEFTSFSNNYRVDITEELQQIFEKIFDFIQSKNLIEEPYEELNYRRLEIEIDCRNSTITISDFYTYYETSETEGVSYEDDEQLDELFDSISKVFDDNGVKDKEFTLDYNGNGDSGYIEDNFSNNIRVPDKVEDWCYRQLENHFGGWEINEGSQGQFIFDSDTKTIELLHTANVEEQINKTIFEEKFSE